MKKINNILFLFAILFFAGCEDYNEKNFPGYDNAKIEDVVVYEGIYDGDYPEVGYFTDKAEVETVVDKMLKNIFLYNDRESTAKVSILFGDITSGLSSADEKYTLEAADYDSMGTESGQPGKYDNFDKNMDIDGYISDFLDKKFTTLEVGKVISVTYKMYVTNEGTNDRISGYVKNANGFEPYELEKYDADYTYTLVANDYTAMGGVVNEPGQFDTTMDVDRYLKIFLGIKYPYAQKDQTAGVTYYYRTGSSVTAEVSYYKYDGTQWDVYNPYPNPTIFYSLTKGDYDSMGTDAGQPGKYDNFDANMDVDKYLIEFCSKKYASVDDGLNVSIIYKYYMTGGGTSDRTNTYKRVDGEWVSVPYIKPFVANLAYTLVADDYEAMNIVSTKPGYLTTSNEPEQTLVALMKEKIPYALADQTVEVLYLSGEKKEEKSAFYQFDGLNWVLLKPYEDSVNVMMKVAEMKFDKNGNWVLVRLSGGSQKVLLGGTEMSYLVDWVSENKKDYMKDDKNEFYFGASSQYNNINNSLNNWRAKDPEDIYAAMSDDKLKSTMNERLIMGIVDIILPKNITNPDSGLLYEVSYIVYEGSTNNYMMVFSYDETEGFEFIEGPVKQ